MRDSPVGSHNCIETGDHTFERVVSGGVEPSAIRFQPLISLHRPTLVDGGAKTSAPPKAQVKVSGAVLEPHKMPPRAVMFSGDR
jgi:hypothetical protein